MASQAASSSGFTSARPIFLCCLLTLEDRSLLRRLVWELSSILPNTLCLRTRFPAPGSSLHDRDYSFHLVSLFRLSLPSKIPWQCKHFVHSPQPPCEAAWVQASLSAEVKALVAHSTLCSSFSWQAACLSLQVVKWFTFTFIFIKWYIVDMLRDDQIRSLFSNLDR